MFPTALQNPGVRFEKVEGPTFYNIGGGTTMVGADEPKNLKNTPSRMAKNLLFLSTLPKYLTLSRLGTRLAGPSKDGLYL